MSGWSIKAIRKSRRIIYHSQVQDEISAEGCSESWLPEPNKELLSEDVLCSDWVKRPRDPNTTLTGPGGQGKMDSLSRGRTGCSGMAASGVTREGILIYINKEEFRPEKSAACCFIQ